LSLAVLLQMGGQFALAQSVPAIHDISTAPCTPARPRRYAKGASTKRTAAKKAPTREKRAHQDG